MAVLRGLWEVEKLFGVPAFKPPGQAVPYRIGNTSKITALQTECETITGARFPQRAYMAPQKAPATAAAPTSMKLREQTCTPA